MNELEPPCLDEAITLLLRTLRAQARSGDWQTRTSRNGYDIYIPKASEEWLQSRASGRSVQQLGKLMSESRRVFAEAGWELTRRGILRPGLAAPGPGTAEGRDGSGYALTVFGEEWLRTSEEDDGFVPMQPDSLSFALARHRAKYGDGFHQRAQEALRCRKSGAWLACCIMAAAAAESVLLALAVAKTGDRDKILKDYHGRAGCHKTINALVAHSPKPVQEKLRGLLGVLSYWRDEASLGEHAEVTSANADQALQQLLRLAQWAASVDWTEAAAAKEALPPGNNGHIAGTANGASNTASASAVSSLSPD